MSDYKRLTKWETSKGVKCVKYWQYSQEQIAERLALLEDKIENGTLVELPCKVGDTVYQFDNAGKIYESKIKQLIYDTGHISFDERAIGTSIFLTKAEAQLKELQEEQK